MNVQVGDRPKLHRAGWGLSQICTVQVGTVPILHRAGWACPQPALRTILTSCGWFEMILHKLVDYYHERAISSCNSAISKAKVRW